MSAKKHSTGGRGRGRISKSLQRLRTLRAITVTGFAVLVAATVMIVTQLAVRKTDDALKNKVISLTSSLGVQMKLNMDSYLSRMETIATLAFADELTYTYDATDPNIPEYDKLNCEKDITAKLNSLCIMENFVDYGIVYPDNTAVGKVSNGSANLFGAKLYDVMSSMISRARTEDGWATGYEGSFKRIYYVKRINEHAVLFLSFYSSELDSVLDNPETLSDMEVRLINGDNNIIYSKNAGEIGEPLPADIVQRIEGRSSGSLLDNDYLVSVNKCGDWSVVCSVPTRIILSEKKDVMQFIYVTGALAAIIAAMAGLYFSFLLTKPVAQIVSALDDKAHIDLLTGVLNKLSFEEFANGCLERSLDSERRALILLDLDNFKGVNDTLGHAQGDKVLENTGRILRETFSDDDYLGRIGGDEFCVLINSRAGTAGDFEKYVREKCGVLCGKFRSNYAGAEHDYKISASVGVSIFPADGRTFSELYNAGDKALYHSKNSGKDTFSFYSEVNPADGGERE